MQGCGRGLSPPEPLPRLTRNWGLSRNWEQGHNGFALGTLSVSQSVVCTYINMHGFGGDLEKQRNDLPSKSLRLFANSQSLRLKSNLVWKAKCIDFQREVRSDLAWSGLKSKHVSSEIWRFTKTKMWLCAGGAHIDVNTLQRNNYFVFKIERNNYTQLWGFGRTRRIVL